MVCRPPDLAALTKPVEGHLVHTFAQSSPQYQVELHAVQNALEAAAYNRHVRVRVSS